VVADPRDLELRRTALDRVRVLQRAYDDLIPQQALAAGFIYQGNRVSFGSFYSGIFRPKELSGPAALCLVTAPPKGTRPPPYEDAFDESAGRFTYRFRDPRAASPAARGAAQRDNEALVAAHDLQVPLIYFRGMAPAQYAVVAPVFLTHVDAAARLVGFEAGLPLADTTGEGLISSPDTRRYATREAVYRLHQHRFRQAVLRAYTSRCAVCSLKETALLQAAHIVDDRQAAGIATVINGIALCAIHHLAYDRNLMGIDPAGVVHISKRLLDDTDGPMLRDGLQFFHRARILQPRRPDERPDPGRLELRYDLFRQAA
jgi:putative restriction endonuclease